MGGDALVVGRGSGGARLGPPDVQGSERCWKLVERTADDGHVIGATEVEGKGGGGGQGLEVLGEDLAAATTTLAMLHGVEEVLEDVVGALHEAAMAGNLFGESDDVAPESFSVAIEVIEDYVDGLASVLGKTTLGAASLQGGAEIADISLNVLQFAGRSFGGWRRLALQVLGHQAQGMA